jgi:hypothetical protein
MVDVGRSTSGERHTASDVDGSGDGRGVFGEATQVTRLATAGDDRTPGEGAVRFASEVKSGWDIGGNANGGYLLAIAGRAMAETTGRPPVTLTAHYLRPASAGPCTIDVSMVRAGRRFATATASLSNDAGEVLRLLGTFGDQVPGGPRYAVDGPPELPPYDECGAPPEPTEGPGPEMFRRLAVRLHPDDVGFRVGRKSGVAEIRGWFDFVDDEPIDAIALLLVADAFPPAVFNTDLPVAWVPTVELTVHVRAVPAPGPLRCSFRSRYIQDGMLDEESEIWDSAGTLVAQSRQLALAPRPPA